VAGVGRHHDAIEQFRFDADSLAFLEERGVVDRPTLDHLADFRFRGDVWGYPEGEVYFPFSPVLVVESSFADGVLLETVLLSVLNHDCAIASAASRMTWAAADRRCIEMGTRRTHEEAAVAAARAAYVAGFDATSNLAAGRRHGIPTTGTSAHSFTLLHDTERDAFTAQVSSLGTGTTLLVDTYDVAEAVAVGIEVAGPELGAVRLDSGDLGVLAERVRAQLDDLGATGTRIVVTSDLDEHAIAALAGAPVDGYGVGTSLVTGSGHPTSGFVYKLVSREGRDGGMVDVAKRSTDKVSVGGRKQAARRYHEDGTAEAEVVRAAASPTAGRERPLLVRLVEAGDVVGREELSVARERHLGVREELPLAARQLSRGEPVLPTLRS
jgi:nicotinate phosphoribosyltransferase